MRSKDWRAESQAFERMHTNARVPGTQRNVHVVTASKQVRDARVVIAVHWGATTAAILLALSATRATIHQHTLRIGDVDKRAARAEHILKPSLLAAVRSRGPTHAVHQAARGGIAQDVRKHCKKRTWQSLHRMHTVEE